MADEVATEITSRTDSLCTGGSIKLGEILCSIVEGNTGTSSVQGRI